MKNIFFLIFIIFVSCKETTNNNTMNVHINVDGLQKGRVVLKKWSDSTFVRVDSKTIDSEKEILLIDKNFSSPEMYYLFLDETNKEMSFFGEKGDVFIKTKLKSVNYKSQVKGSVNDSVYRVYKETIRKFNNNQLDLIKAKFDFKDDKKKFDSIEVKLSNLDKRQLRYRLNFVFTHGDYEVAPYIALTDLNNLTIKYLDTLNTKFSKKVKDSKYGKNFTKYVKERKEIN